MILSLSVCCAGGHAMLWQVGTVEVALENLKLEMASIGLSPDMRLAVTPKRSRADHLVSLLQQTITLPRRLVSDCHTQQQYCLELCDTRRRWRRRVTFIWTRRTTMPTPPVLMGSGRGYHYSLCPANVLRRVWYEQLLRYAAASFFSSDFFVDRGRALPLRLA